MNEVKVGRSHDCGRTWFVYKIMSMMKNGKLYSYYLLHTSFQNILLHHFHSSITNFHHLHRLSPATFPLHPIVTRLFWARSLLIRNHCIASSLLSVDSSLTRKASFKKGHSKSTIRDVSMEIVLGWHLSSVGRVEWNVYTSLSRIYTNLTAFDGDYIDERIKGTFISVILPYLLNKIKRNCSAIENNVQTEPKTNKQYGWLSTTCAATVQPSAI